MERSGGIRSAISHYGPWIVAAAFSISGVVHLVHPSTFTKIVPHFLPFSTTLVYASGAAELVCAFGLWRRQRWAGYAATILLLAVWPANLQDAITTQGGHHDGMVQVLTWLRLPLQVPLIWFALQSRQRLFVSQGLARGREICTAPRIRPPSGSAQSSHPDRPARSSERRSHR
jgi:uncharacterized membrane protein